MQPVHVMRGKHVEATLVGPLPGVLRAGIVAYEFELPERFVPWPGRTRLERTFVDLELGVSMADVCWRYAATTDGETVPGLGEKDEGTWYVDLVEVERDDDRFVFRDLYIDAIVPMDGRHHRIVDLEEFADAIADGSLAVRTAIDGLRRWQLFLDRHLQSREGTGGVWPDFPPAAIERLRALQAPLGPTVKVK